MSSNSMVKRATVRDSRLDRISDLPDDVIENILERLTLREAVRTSILSRRWRYKWVTIPDLTTDPGRRSLTLPGYTRWDVESAFGRLPARDDSRIAEFNFTCTNAELHPAMDRWIHLLLDHPIERLSLRWHFLGPDVDPHLLPSPLFSFDHIKHLCLGEVKVTPPPEFSGLSKIVKLELWRVKIELKELETIISRCPMLASLKLISCIGTQLWFLDIDAPNLKCFRFHGKFSGISFRNASIVDIRITLLHVFDNFELRGSRSNLVEVFNQLLSIKKVSLNGAFLQFLALGGDLQMLPSNLNHLILLEIEDLDSGAVDQISSALCLIKSSPNLQFLEIYFDDVDEEDGASAEYLRAQQMCNVPLSHLKCVRLCCMSGLESQLEFVKLILLWATALELLEIVTWFRKETDDESDVDPNDENDYETLLKKHEILKKIASYRHASSKLTLILDKF